jgi:hypothetical protein
MQSRHRPTCARRGSEGRIRKCRHDTGRTVMVLNYRRPLALIGYLGQCGEVVRDFRHRLLAPPIV